VLAALSRLLPWPLRMSRLVTPDTGPRPHHHSPVTDLATARIRRRKVLGVTTRSRLGDGIFGTHRTNRWKAALNAFDGRLTAGRK